jgi:hypothetical protein
LVSVPGCHCEIPSVIQKAEAVSLNGKQHHVLNPIGLGAELSLAAACVDDAPELEQGVGCGDTHPNQRIHVLSVDKEVGVCDH